MTGATIKRRPRRRAGGIIGAFSVTGTDRKDADMLDLAFVGLSIVFFAIAIGYIAGCERLMK